MHYNSFWFVYTMYLLDIIKTVFTVWGAATALP